MNITKKISVEFLDYMGDDLDVVNAARVSFAKEKEVIDSADENLIDFLARNNHWSPFAHQFLKFRVRAPIFVARQLQKHTVGLAWNEVSRRYVDREPEFFFPEMRERAPNVKQGSSKNVVKGVETIVLDAFEKSCVVYNALIGQGVAPEVARAVLPQAMMTEWIWSGSLYAFIRVCQLRLDLHAQEETRQVAVQIFTHMRKVFPISVKVFLGENA